MHAQDREPPAPNGTSEASEKVDDENGSPEVGDEQVPGNDTSKNSEGESSNGTLIVTPRLTL